MSDSYKKIRNHAGLIDLENWARFEVRGGDAVSALDSVMGGNVAAMFGGRAMNTLIPTADGGVEAILWLIMTETGFLVLAEPEDAAPIAETLNGLTKDFDVTITDSTATLFHLMLTGPEAETLATTSLGDDITSIAFLSSYELPSGITAMRIGYLGEYELHLIGAKAQKDETIDAITAVGGAEIMTDQNAFPVMMTEMRMLNRTRDIPPDASVFDAGLQWMVDFQKPNLRGAAGLDKRREENSRILVLALMDSEPTTDALTIQGEDIGKIQSAYHSETLDKTVALIYLEADIAVAGLTLDCGSGVVKTISAPAFLSKSIINTIGNSG